MPTTPARPNSRIDPQVAWSVMTDAPLRGMALAREAGAIIAWDEADQLYRIGARGDFQSVARAPGRILGAAVSDDGAVIALLGDGGHLWLMSGDFDLRHERTSIVDPLSIAVDPHGRFVAVGSKMSLVQFYSVHGRPAGRIETKQPLASLTFVPSRPYLVGIGAYGSICGIDLFAERTKGHLDGETVWYEALMSSVGRLATTGDGAMILVSCFTHGVQRYNLDGKGEGAYHLGGSAGQAVPDFSGRLIAVTTDEGELILLSGTGAVRWRTSLGRPASALETDALGRFVVHGAATGAITRLDLQPNERTTQRGDDGAGSGVGSRPQPTTANAPHQPQTRGNGTVRQPAWTVPSVVETEEQADFAVLAVAEQPTRIGVLSSRNRLELLDTKGRRVGQAPEIDGVGRILRTCPGWMAAATDRRIILCDLAKNTAQRVDLSITELTHLAIQPATYGLAIVQERDRIGRATVAGRWIWRQELDSPIEDLAIHPDGSTAVTTEDGRLRIFDPSGHQLEGFQGKPGDPALLHSAPAGSPVAWVTLSRRTQTLRGHDEEGHIAWSAVLPWEAWQFTVVGDKLVALAPDGRGVAYDSGGRLVEQGRSEGPADAFLPASNGRPLRVNRRAVHLIGADLSGQVGWRFVADKPLGPLATGPAGLAILVGRDLAWFPTNPSLGESTRIGSREMWQKLILRLPTVRRVS